MELEKAIRKIIEQKVDELGRSDLYRKPLVAFSDAHNEKYRRLKFLVGDWHELPEVFLENAQSVISYFIPFAKAVTLSPQAVENGAELWSEAYQEINIYFEKINQAICDFLEKRGYQAVGIKATHTYDPQNLRASWSHRSAAVISGLATFGANRLAITEKGSAGRFCSVITSAKLCNDRKFEVPKCYFLEDDSQCGLCFKACPTGALLPNSLEKFVCQNELNKNEQLITAETKLKSADTCGKCISVCPFAYLD